MVNVQFAVMRHIAAIFINTDVSEEHTASVFSVKEYSTVDILTNIQGVTHRIPRYLRSVTLFRTLIYIIIVIQSTNA
jgi:hypothetical protein